MRLTYADEEFYATVFRSGCLPLPVSGATFNYFARMATKEIRARTFGNIKEDQETPEEVKMCCCEVAEWLAEANKKKDDNGRILQSYSNDGDSGAYQVEDLSAGAQEKEITKIVRSWLLDTGLMYCGVKRR